MIRIIIIATASAMTDYIGGDYYDGNNEGGWYPKKWETYTVGHKHFAGKDDGL